MGYIPFVQFPKLFTQIQYGGAQVIVQLLVGAFRFLYHPYLVDFPVTPPGDGCGQPTGR